MHTEDLDVLTSGQAAELLGCTVQHVRRLVRSGTLDGSKHGRDWVVQRSSVQRHLANRYNTELPLRFDSENDL